MVLVRPWTTLVEYGLRLGPSRLSPSRIGVISNADDTLALVRIRRLNIQKAVRLATVGISLGP